MNDFKFVSDQYEIKNISQYRLSIQINQDGFSFLIDDSDRNILQLVHNQTGSIQNTINLFKTDEKLDTFRRLSFSQLNIIFNNTAYNLVPEELYEPKYQEFLINNSNQISPDDIILNYKLESLNAQILYSLDHNLQELKNLFINAPRTKHIVSVFLDYISLNHKLNEEVFIYHAGSVVHIGIIRNNKIVFINSFNCNTSEELIFHCANICHIQKPGKASGIYYAGELCADSQEISSLKQYIPNLSFIPNRLPFGIAGEKNENYYINMLTPGSN